MQASPRLFEEEQMSLTLSVVMCAFNEEAYIRESIQSLTGNTFKDFKILIVDDGSTDSTTAILNEFQMSDKRILVIRNEKNLGIALSTNIALSHCKTDFIAIMDADDICLPNRLQVQVDYLNRNPGIDVVGSSMYILSGLENNEIRTARQKNLRNMLLKENIIFNPTVMFRQNLVEDGNFNCNPRYRHTQDYHIWTKLAIKSNFANIEEPLVIYRDNKAQNSNSNSNPFRRELEVIVIRSTFLARLIVTGNFELVHIRYFLASLVKGTIPAFSEIFKYWVRQLKSSINLNLLKN